MSDELILVIIFKGGQFMRIPLFSSQAQEVTHSLVTHINDILKDKNHPAPYHFFTTSIGQDFADIREICGFYWIEKPVSDQMMERMTRAMEKMAQEHGDDWWKEKGDK